MTIGEALKEEQEKLGLTANKMAAGIISKGTYSKVVNDKARISSDLLLKILYIHKIDITNFFNKTKDTYAPSKLILEEQISQKLGVAFNNRDIKSVKKYLSSLQDIDGDIYLIQRAQIAVAFLSNNLKILDKNFSNIIIDELNDHENWITDLQALRLFANSMIVLPKNTVEIEMQLFFRRLNRMKIDSESMVERYAIICCNYLHWKYDHFHSAKTGEDNVKNALNYLHELNLNPHFMIYRLEEKYYRNLFENNLVQALKVKNNLEELGVWKFNKKLACLKQEVSYMKLLVFFFKNGSIFISKIK